MVKLYRQKRPRRPVQAIQWDGHNKEEIVEFIGNVGLGPEEDSLGVLKWFHQGNYHHLILEDYVVKDGEVFFCHKAIFEDFYELIHEFEETRPYFTLVPIRKVMTFDGEPACFVTFRPGYCKFLQHWRDDPEGTEIPRCCFTDNPVVLETDPKDPDRIVPHPDCVVWKGELNG